MIINVKNNDPRDDTPLDLTPKEFWTLFLTLRTTLTNKEIDVASDFFSGNPKPIKGNYKTYVNKLKKKGIELKERTIPTNPTIQIKINVT